MKSLVGLFLFSFLFQWNSAQSSIQGQTIDNKEKPVPFVNVYMVDKAGKETGITTVTDSAGNYSFGNLMPGKYCLKLPVSRIKHSLQNLLLW